MTRPIGAENETDGFDLTDFYEKMMDQESDTFTFAVRRTPERGKTLSADAMTQLRDVFSAFVGARLSASLRRRGKDGDGHSEVAIELNVRIDGETQLVPENLHPWYALTDGEHRA